MKVLVTGINGQLGYAVLKELRARNIPCQGAGRAQFDITDFTAAYNFIKDYKPDAVIHCAAYTAVDKAEDEAALCRLINVQGTENIAKACRSIDAKMLYISTDYVFPGEGAAFYEVDDKTGPLGVYGQTKLEGEQKVKALLDKYFIVRISWVFGANGNNFVKTMLRLGQEQEAINVVTDQIGSPTYTVDAARLLCEMAVSDKYGIYHATNEGVCSWAEFSKEIFKQAGYKTRVTSIKSAAYKTKAVRPLNSRLSKKSLEEAGFTRLPVWQDAVKRYLQEMQFIV